jgi:hypothetical protein
MVQRGRTAHITTMAFRCSLAVKDVILGKGGVWKYAENTEENEGDEK